MQKRVRKVVFPVGGLGTRFLPATKSLPKEMLPVVDKPIIHYAFEEAMASGIEQFIFVTGRNKTAIDNHFDHAYELQNVLVNKDKRAALKEVTDWLPDPGCVFFTRQQASKGLGHAVWCARHLIGDEPFAVILPDDMILATNPCLKQMMDAHQEVGGNMVATMEVPQNMTSSYGVIEPQSENGNLVKARSVVEKPAPEDAPSNMAIVGRYVLQPEIFDILGKQHKGAGGEIQLTDAINTMAKDMPTHGLRFEGRRYDCGNRLGFVEANIAFALSRPDMKDRVQSMLREYMHVSA
ncbi:MAG: UTP--glucose-1-phosphate uridylyltransferase GalU [Alphaproteobacteria bacterium]|nr:UTP--glucose-1-phosphate uridylyltransferase GalU [Alphaproteobacteria bacterium]